MNIETKQPPQIVVHILTFVFTCSYLIFAFVIWFSQNQVTTQPASGPADLPESFGQILLVLSVVFLALSVPVRGVLLKMTKDKAGAFINAHLLSLVIREMGVIMAFVYSYTRHETMQVSLAAGAAVILTIFTWPRSEQKVI